MEKVRERKCEWLKLLIELNQKRHPLFPKHLDF